MFLLLSTINIRAHIYYIGVRVPPNNEKTDSPANGFQPICEVVKK